MEDVIDSLSSNHMRELSELFEGKNVLHSKWEYRLEHDGSKRYKEILVVKGENEVIGYTDIFSLMVKLTTIRIVLGLMLKDVTPQIRRLSSLYQDESFQRAYVLTHTHP